MYPRRAFTPNMPRCGLQRWLPSAYIRRLREFCTRLFRHSSIPRSLPIPFQAVHYCRFQETKHTITANVVASEAINPPLRRLPPALPLHIKPKTKLAPTAEKTIIGSNREHVLFPLIQLPQPRVPLLINPPEISTSVPRGRGIPPAQQQRAVLEAPIAGEVPDGQ